MKREQRLQLIKLMVESLEIPEWEEHESTWGNFKTYKDNVSWQEFNRKCVQIRKEIMHLLNGGK